MTRRVEVVDVGIWEYDPDDPDDTYEPVWRFINDVMLFHWSPTARRKQILRYGLRPSMRATLTSEETWKAPYVCFGDTPRWGWGLSGGMRWAPSGSWDLWSTWLSDLGPGSVVNDDGRGGIYEVRTPNRVFKKDLWYVGSRMKS